MYFTAQQSKTKIILIFTRSHFLFLVQLVFAMTPSTWRQKPSGSLVNNFHICSLQQIVHSFKVITNVIVIGFHFEINFQIML